MELRKLKDKATEAFTKGRFSKAAELYEEYCRADPKDHQSRLRTGDAWVKAGQRERAISAYQAAAEGFAKEGFLPRAIAASKLILELDPAHRGVQQMLADLYARRGTPAGARARGPMGSALVGAPAPVQEPVTTSRLPAAVRAAVAEINLDVEVEPPQSLSTGGAPVDLSSELPAELSLSVDEAPAPAASKLPASTAPAARASGAPTELSVDPIPGARASESPSELSLTVDAAPSTGAAVGAEEEVLSVSVGLSHLGPEAGETAHAPTGDEPILMGEAVEEAEPVVMGQGLSEDDGSSDVATGRAQPAVAAPPSEAPTAAVTGGPAAPSPGDSTRTMGAAVPRAASAPPAGTPGPAAGTTVVPAARPSSASLPPGLTPRASQRVAAPPAPSPARNMPLAEELPPVRTPSGKWKALSSPIADPSIPAPASPQPSMPPEPAASALPEPTASAPPGLRPRRAEPQAPAGATALPFSPALGVSLRASAGPSSFTELELEADSLLHAVELAAQAGLSQRAAMSVATDDEEVYSLTEEVGTDGRALNELPTVPLFSDLPRDAFIELFERCPLRRFGPGERIIEQGTRGDAFYVICEGAVRVFRTEDGQRQDLATLEGGACFGEMALLSGAARTASVEGASEDTQLLEISAPVLAELSRSYPLVAQALKKFCRQRLLTNVMNTSALFRPFNRKDRRTLVERFRARDVERDDVIIRDGDQTDGLYVVLSGEVEVSKDGILLTRLKEGELFGEISLLQKTPATATVTAARHTTLLRLPRTDFDTLISSHPQVLVLISELSDERLLRTQRVLGAASGGTPGDEDLILV
jgi:CRP-like cAMP-binding protein